MYPVYSAQEVRMRPLKCLEMRRPHQMTIRSLLFPKPGVMILSPAFLPICLLPLEVIYYLNKYFLASLVCFHLTFCFIRRQAFGWSSVAPQTTDTAKIRSKHQV